MNALSHGLTAKSVVIKGEDPEAFEALREDFISEFLPETTLEHQLVDRLAGIFWRLRRIPEIEASLIEAHRLEIEHADAKDEAHELRFPPTFDPNGQIEKTRKRLYSPSALLGRAFLKSVEHLDTIGKLSRYERDLVRNLNSILDQLKKAKSNRNDTGNQAKVVELKAITENEWICCIAANGFVS